MTKKNVVREIIVCCPDCGDKVKVNIEGVPNEYYVGCNCKRPICNLILK